jgi:glycosyltransferase involved in cell wall biosynthesis
LVDESPRTVRLKNVRYTEMHELYGLADVLFLPSRGEGLPLTLQEALLCGLPAVVSKDPSYVENVADAPGVLLREGVAAWADAVVQAIESPVAASVIAQWATAHFGRALFLNGYEAAYRELLAR